jgi:hypothetical protein
MKKGVRKGALGSLVKQSNLDWIDSSPSLTDEDSEGLLSFSILNGLHSILITKSFPMEFNP